MKIQIFNVKTTFCQNCDKKAEIIIYENSNHTFLCEDCSKVRFKNVEKNCGKLMTLDDLNLNKPGIKLEITNLKGQKIICTFKSKEQFVSGNNRVLNSRYYLRDEEKNEDLMFMGGVLAKIL